MCDRRVLGALLMLAVLLAAAWGDTESELEPAAGSPEAVFKAWQTAIVKKDYGAYFDLLCGELRGEFEELFQPAQSPGHERDRVMELLGLTAEELDSMSLRAFAAKVLAFMAARNEEEYGSLAESVGETMLLGKPEIEGDTCRLRFTTVEGGNPVGMVLRREDGRWLLYEPGPFETAIEADPEARRAKEAAKLRVTCMNNLRMIGALLITLEAGDSLDESLSGPAFLLQVAIDVRDEDLDIFICPGEPKDAAPDRPKVGSPEFVKMFRELTPEKLREDRDWSKYTSYAGPNFKDFPRARAGAAARMTRLWACDRCKDGKPHHDGIVVLYSSSKVDFLKLPDLPNVPGPSIPVGPDSPDERLKTLIFGPRDD